MLLGRRVTLDDRDGEIIAIHFLESVGKLQLIVWVKWNSGSIKDYNICDLIMEKSNGN